MGRHAYTLMEVLAVTVLLGLVASLGAPPLLRAISGDPLGRAAGQLAQSFRDVRAQAYGHPVSLGLDGSGFTAAMMDEGVRTALPTLRLSDDVQVSWSRRGQSVRQLELDARGHGLDTDVILRHDSRDMRFTINGLTGTWQAQASP